MHGLVLIFTYVKPPISTTIKRCTMNTLDLLEAADFLLMNAEVLRRKACKGDVPGRKTGKRWVFIKAEVSQFFMSVNF